MGPGKAELLMAIRDSGSIAAAGRALGMSYQKTRQLVDEMNSSFKTPLIEGFKGGVQGGGARLTNLGTEVLVRFQAMQDLAEAAVKDEIADFQQLLAR